MKDEGQIYWAWSSPLSFSLSFHLSLSLTLTHALLFSGMPMSFEQSEHEAMQQFDCSGSLPRKEKKKKHNCYNYSESFNSADGFTVMGGTDF